MVLKGAFVTPRGDLDQRIPFTSSLSFRLFTCLFVPFTSATCTVLTSLKEQKDDQLSHFLDGKLMEVCVEQYRR